MLYCVHYPSVLFILSLSTMYIPLAAFLPDHKNTEPRGTRISCVAGDDLSSDVWRTILSNSVTHVKHRIFFSPYCLLQSRKHVIISSFKILGISIFHRNIPFWEWQKVLLPWLIKFMKKHSCNVFLFDGNSPGYQNNILMLSRNWITGNVHDFHCDSSKAVNRGTASRP